MDRKTQSSTRREHSHLFPYPEALPPTPALHPAPGERALFWRAVWLKAVLEHQAFERFCFRGDYSKRPRALQLAISKALSGQREKIAAEFAKLREAGGLLYAWLPDAKGQPS